MWLPWVCTIWMLFSAPHIVVVVDAALLYSMFAVSFSAVVYLCTPFAFFNCLADTKQWRPIDFFPSNAFPQKKIMDSHWLSANRQQVNSSSCNILTNFMCTIYAHCSTSALRHGHQYMKSLSCKYIYKVQWFWLHIICQLTAAEVAC